MIPKNKQNPINDVDNLFKMVYLHALSLKQYSYFRTDFLILKQLLENHIVCVESSEQKLDDQVSASLPVCFLLTPLSHKIMNFVWANFIDLAFVAVSLLYILLTIRNAIYYRR